MSLAPIDFDRPDSWSTSLSRAVEHVVTDEVITALKKSKPKWREDSRELLFELAPKRQVIDAAIKWLEGECLVAYHGTRLTQEERASVEAIGLLPLTAGSRRERLYRALSRHPRWDDVSGRLEIEIERHGPGHKMGQREGQVHLTLSRAGLVKGFNHYVLYGSEYDQRVAHALLGEEGVELLAEDGIASLVSVCVPGKAALAAAHPHFTVSDVLSMGEVPNIISDFLYVWSYCFPAPEYDPSKSRVDCGLVFRESVPTSWIVEIQTVETEVREGRRR